MQSRDIGVGYQKVTGTLVRKTGKAIFLTRPKSFVTMRNTFKILFYVKRKEPLRNGELPIMGRITIDGRRAHFSTRLSVPAQLWEASSVRAAGRCVSGRRINERLS